jgi:hypothetical protein
MPSYPYDEAPIYRTQPVAPRVEGAPWQIRIVVAMLGLEGLGNLAMIQSHPIAIQWVLFKILFIVGLLRGWRFVFGLFMVMAAIHVFGFLQISPFVSFLNFAMMVLVFFARSYFFGRGGSVP